jgi:hypothetical protein
MATLGVKSIPPMNSSNETRPVPSTLCSRWYFTSKVAPRMIDNVHDGYVELIEQGREVFMSRRNVKGNG